MGTGRAWVAGVVGAVATERGGGCCSLVLGSDEDKGGSVEMHFCLHGDIWWTQGGLQRGVKWTFISSVVSRMLKNGLPNPL